MFCTPQILMNVRQAMLSVTGMLRASTPQALSTVRASKVTQAMAVLAEVSFYNSAMPNVDNTT